MSLELEHIFLQAGRDVYRRPQNLAAARLFSDPPLNELAVEKRGAAVVTTTGRQLPAAGVLANLPDGRYTLGFHYDEAALSRNPPNALSFPGTVSVTELSGSESFVHVDTGLVTWVCLVRGVYDWQPGAPAEASADMQRAFAFDHAKIPRRIPRHGSLGMTRITLDGVAHSYTSHPRNEEDYALRPLHQVWQQGMAYALLGPSGCGKTTLLNIISGLIIRSEGRLLFDDRDFTRLPTEQRTSLRSSSSR